jgi:hypothetical protein
VLQNEKYVLHSGVNSPGILDADGLTTNLNQGVQYRSEKLISRSAGRPFGPVFVKAVLQPQMKKYRSL